MSSQTPTQAPDDSPFSADNAKVPIGGTSSEPAVMAAESVNSNGAQPPAYTASGQQQITTADFQVGRMVEKYSLNYRVKDIDLQCFL